MTRMLLFQEVFKVYDHVIPVFDRTGWLTTTKKNVVLIKNNYGTFEDWWLYQVSCARPRPRAHVTARPREDRSCMV